MLLWQKPCDDHSAHVKLASSKSMQTVVVLATGPAVTMPDVDMATGPTVTLAAIGTNTVKFVAAAAEDAGGLVAGWLVAGGRVVCC